MTRSIQTPSISMRKTLTGLWLLAAAPAVWAHPGDHGSSWFEAAMHLLSEPDHLAGIMLALVAAVWGVRALLRRR